jgi:hypothetical protein
VAPLEGCSQCAAECDSCVETQLSGTDGSTLKLTQDFSKINFLVPVKIPACGDLLARGHLLS